MELAYTELEKFKRWALKWYNNYCYTVVMLSYVFSENTIYRFVALHVSYTVHVY